MSNTVTELERLADAITLLKRNPHTAAELAARLNVRPASARRWCKVFEDKGHVTATEKLVRGNVTKTWEWV